MRHLICAAPAESQFRVGSGVEGFRVYRVWGAGLRVWGYQVSDLVVAGLY